jgi:hypothetical protein
MQAFNDYVNAVESDYGMLAVQRDHCRMMRGVNTVLERLLRKRAGSAADFTVTAIAVLDMRLCLLERVAATMQQSVTQIAESSVRAGRVAEAAAAEAAGKVPAAMGLEMLAGMHALVRALSEAVAARLSHDSMASMQQVRPHATPAEGGASAHA